MGARFEKRLWWVGWGSRGVGGTPGSYICDTEVNMKTTM